MKKVIVIVLTLFVASFFANPVFADGNGDMAAGLTNLIFTVIGSIPTGNAKQIPMEKKDLLPKSSKEALVKMAAQSNKKVKFGDLMQNVFTKEYFVALYNVKVNGENKALGLLFKAKSPGLVDNATYYDGQEFDPKELAGAIQKGPEKTTVYLRQGFLNTVDIDPTISITDKLTTVVLKSAEAKDSIYVDVLSDTDKQRVADYIKLCYDADTIKVLGLKENIIIGSALMPIYDVRIDDKETGILALYYRQTTEGRYASVRDPMIGPEKERAAIEQILKDPPDKKNSFLSGLLRQNHLNPEDPPLQIAAGEAAKPDPKKETPLDILKARYAKGEVTKEQFDQMKEDLK